MDWKTRRYLLVNVDPSATDLVVYKILHEFSTAKIHFPRNANPRRQFDDEICPCVPYRFIVSTQRDQTDSLLDFTHCYLGKITFKELYKNEPRHETRVS